MVTGAASGIGLALAEELLESDAAKVVLADINQANLTGHETRLKARYGDCVKGVLCDVTAEEDVQRLIAVAVDFFSVSFDLLFNNAGTGFSGRFEEHNNGDWKAAFDLNFYGALYGMRAVLPIMKKQGGGQIINIISGITFMPMAYQSRYNAAKAALNGLSLALRSEYWDDNIKISSATPGLAAIAIFACEGAPTPEAAQSPHQAARRILKGVVNNDRIIFGGDEDVHFGKYGSNPDANKDNDMYLLRVERERRAGKVAF